MKKTCLTLGAACAAMAANAAIMYQENFMNYADLLPGAVQDVKHLYLSNDPIWNSQGSLTVSFEEKTAIFLKPIAVPKGKFDLAMDFQLRNSVFPAEAKGDKPAVAADWDFFELEFSAGAQKKAVRIAADQIAGKPLEKKLLNWNWYQVGFVGNGSKLQVYFSNCRKYELFTELDLGFVPEGVNWIGYGNKNFCYSRVVLTDGDGLPKFDAARFFASFKSLEQPLANAKTAAKDETVDVTPSPRAGVRFVFGDQAKSAKFVCEWSDGAKSEYPVTVENVSDSISAAAFGNPRGTKLALTNTLISIKGLVGRYVRPKLNCFKNSYAIEPMGIDVIRDWNLLPGAAKHPLSLDLVRSGDRVQFWLDGSYVRDLPAPRKAVKKGETPPPAPTLKNAKLVFSEGVKYAKREFPKVDESRFTVIDLAACPKAKAFAGEKVTKAPAKEIGGYPLAPVAAIDSADLAICHQALGNWALEVEEYHGRAPEDGYPAGVHFRVPAAPYVRAGIVFAIDPDRRKDAIMTLRLGRYQHNGSGGNLSAANTYDFTKGVPDWCRQVGEVTLKGKKVPLYFGDFALNIGSIIDLTLRDYLDFDVNGKQWENLQQLDNSMKPDPKSDSAFNLFAVTLQKAKFSFGVVEKEGAPGNVFTEDEKDRTMGLRLRALVDSVKGEIKWTARDVDGRELFTKDEKVSFAKAGDEKDLTVDFGAKTPRGFYTLDVDAIDEKGVKLFTHEARFAVLPDAKRDVDATNSPYATWWFNSHGSPGDEMIGFPILKKAGIRKHSWREPSAADTAKWGTLSCGNTYGLGNRDLEKDEKGEYTGRFKGDTVMVPDPADPKKKIKKERSGEERFVERVKADIAKRGWVNHLLIWHESAPGCGVPSELLNPGMGLDESDKTEQMLQRAKMCGAMINATGRIMRKHFPDLKIQIGNSSASMGAGALPFRGGANPDYVDCLGMETPAQVVTPERRTEIGVLGMLATQDCASRYAKRKVPLNGAWEFIYRADRDMGEQLMAEWHARDVLICLAHDFFLISPGILFDCSNGYYNGLWGGAGLLQRGPYVYPKRAYVAYAVATKVLDGVKFTRELDTGSSTIYALEYRRLDGKYVTALWCARGEAEFEVDQDTGFFGGKTVMTEMYGTETSLAKGVVKVTAGGAPVYLTSEKPLKGVKVTGRTFKTDAALAAKAKTAATLENAGDFFLKADDQIESTHHNFFPVMKKGEFTLAQAEDPEKGKCLEVAMDLGKNKDRSEYYTEYTTVRFRNPAPVEGEPDVIGVWVKGDSNWGQIRFEITDADGEVFKNLSTGKDWCCDVQDWPGNLAVNFDGWNYVYTMLKPTDLVRTHSPGPYADQWVSEGGDKKIKFPIRITAITVGMNRYQTSLFRFLKETPGPAKILLKDAGTVSK